ncbi:hypothetical protein [Micromonospora cremea]|nr:hypothetical protein [Micromonospora cremea]
MPGWLAVAAVRGGHRRPALGFASTTSLDVALDEVVPRVTRSVAEGSL